MKALLTAFLLLPIAACVLCCPSLGSTISNVPSDHRIHEYVEELGRRGIFRSFFFSDRPYTRESILEAMAQVDEAVSSGSTRVSPYEAWLLNRLKDEFGYLIEEERTTRVQKIQLGAEIDVVGILTGSETAWVEDTDGESDEKLTESEETAQGILLAWADYSTPHVGISSRFRIDTRVEDDPGFLGRPWRGETGGQVVSGYGRLCLETFEVLLGRDELYWGPGSSGSLILSDAGPPMDMVSFRVDLGRVSAMGFFTTLDDMELSRTVQYGSDSLYAGTVLTRHLSGHRIDVRVTPALEIGLSETVVYGGPDRGLEPGYINPLNFFYGHQWNLSKNDNPIWALDATWWPLDRLQLYGQLMVDDYQFEHKSERDEEPAEIGFLLGLYSGDPFGVENTSAAFEYARVNPWTYNQPYEWNRYTYGNAMLGHPIGSDADVIHVMVKRWFDERFTAQLDYRFLRRGEIEVDTEWPVPVMGPWYGASFPEGDFPFGTVAQSHRIGLMVRFHPYANLEVEAFGSVERTKDHGNVEGTDESGYELGLRVNFRPETVLALGE